VTSATLTGADRHPLHSDAELVQRWLRAQRPAKRGGAFLWAKVARQFCVGSTSATQICKRHGFDPDLLVTLRE
jgi:hypothetical protein